MRIIDPGHVYECDSYDGGEPVRITFMKREGRRYPGNTGSHPGTNLQEVMRVMIHRAQYLDNQEQDACNAHVINDQRSSIRNLEMRAARRHGLPNPGFTRTPETMPTCCRCGHVACACGSLALPTPPTPKEDALATKGLPDGSECECCGHLASKADVEGVPLCDDCYEDLKRETNAILSPDVGGGSEG